MTVTLTAGQSAAIFLVLLRCTALVFAAPIFGHHAVPTLVKFGLGAALTVAMVKGIAPAPDAVPLVLAAPLEVVIGLSLGFVLSLGFQAVELAGRLISIQTGLSLGNVYNPLQEDQSTALDPFFSIMAGLLFLAMGLHLAIVKVLARSFEVYPLGGGWPIDLPLTAAQTTALALELGVRVALPLALVLLLAELAVALLSRAIPQINVFMFGIPIKMVIGFALLAVAMPTLISGAASIYRFIFSAASGGVISS